MEGYLGSVDISSRSHAPVIELAEMCAGMPSGRFASRDRGTAQTGRETSDLHSHAHFGKLNDRSVGTR